MTVSDGVSPSPKGGGAKPAPPLNAPLFNAGGGFKEALGGRRHTVQPSGGAGG